MAQETEYAVFHSRPLLGKIRGHKRYHERLSTLPRRILNRLANAAEEGFGKDSDATEKKQMAVVALASSALLAALHAAPSKGPAIDFSGVTETVLEVLGQPGFNQMLPLGVILGALSVKSLVENARRVVPLSERVRPLPVDSRF